MSKLRIQHTIKPSCLLAGIALALTGSNIQAQVGSWRMDRGSGQTVRDSAQGHHGVFGATGAVEATDPTWSTSGIAGKALQFGGDDYVTVPDHPKLRLVGDMTICASVYIDAFSRNDWVRIVGKNSGKGENNRNFGLWYSAESSFLFQIYGVGNRGHANAYLKSGGKILPGRWYSLVGVRKGKSVLLYVNGNPVGSATLGAAPCTGTGPVTIGKAPTLKSAGHKGKIDRVVIYNRALSAKEIRSAFSHAPPAVRKPRVSKAQAKAKAKAQAAADAAAFQLIQKEEFALKPQIDAAIGRGVKHLLNGQLRDGSFGGGNYPVGRTALRVYALVKCGVRADHPVIRRAYTYLKTARTNRTYSVACAMLAFGVTGDPQYHGQLRKLLTILLRAQGGNGAFGYPGNIDLSNSQYAALGLWVAHKAGIKIDQKVWTRLVDGTLAHQETPRDVGVKITKRTGVGQLQVAGFAYRAIRKPGGAAAVKHTMTTAGVSILKICEIGLGKRLRKQDRHRIQHAVQLGLNFFEAHYSVTTGGSWMLYYLYGLERVGALTRVEQIGDHWWYVDGARHLLNKQNKKSGAWGKNAHDTAFALLFLRRATSYSGPISGGSSSGSTTHLFSAGGPKADIALRGAGQQPVMLYINGFGEALLAEHGEYGLRIMRVEYFEGRRKLGELAGNPTKAWKNDTFLYRSMTLAYGSHTVEARITAIDPNTPPGDTSKTVTIKSEPMKVTIRDVVEPWMESIAKMQTDNLLPTLGKKLVLKASSNQKTVKAACDGNDSTHWLADVKDATPTLTFEFPELTLVRRLTVTQALQNRGSLASRGVIRTIEVALGKTSKFERIEMHQNPLAPTEFNFSRSRKVRKMTLRIVRRTGKPGLPLGFAEIALSRQRSANSPK